MKSLKRPKTSSHKIDNSRSGCLSIITLIITVISIIVLTSCIKNGPTLYRCSDGDDDCQSVRELPTCQENVITWNKLDTVVIGDGREAPRERMSVLKKKVGEHNYREFCIEQGENGYHFVVYDSCHHNHQEIVFDADKYMNEGVPGMYAFVSPDKRYVYVVGDILANSTGWVSTFIIYQVNTETLKAKLINAVAGVRLEKNGFTVASMTRCVTPDAQCSSGMDFAFEDITYGFNGRIKRRSKEYASKEIKKRYGESLNNLRGLGIMRGQYDE